MSSNKKKQDIGACIFIYLLLIAILIPTFSMRNGAEYMPRLIAGIAGLCNTILLIRVLRTKADDSQGNPKYLDLHTLAVPVLAFIGMVVYAVIVKYTNYFIATAIFLPCFMLAEKIRKFWLILLIDGIYLGFIYVMFVIVLKVPMI